MPDHSRTDLTFLREAVRRLDDGGAVGGRDVGSALNLTKQETIGCFKRLRDRQLVETKPGPRRMGNAEDGFLLGVTPAGYRVVGDSLIGD